MAGTFAGELEKHAAEELQHAIIIAKHIDYLGGTPVTTPLPVKMSDDPATLLRADLENENKWDDSGVKVSPVNKGVVLLSGKTKSLAAHLESVEVANAVRGVRRVSTEVEVVPAS